MSPELVSVLASVRFSFLIYETTSSLYPMELLEENTEKVPGRTNANSLPSIITFIEKGQKPLVFSILPLRICVVLFSLIYEGWEKMYPSQGCKSLKLSLSLNIFVPLRIGSPRRR